MPTLTDSNMLIQKIFLRRYTKHMSKKIITLSNIVFQSMHKIYLTDLQYTF